VAERAVESGLQLAEDGVQRRVFRQATGGWKSTPH
jgi:hypothetical protein